MCFIVGFNGCSNKLGRETTEAFCFRCFSLKDESSSYDLLGDSTNLLLLYYPLWLEGGSSRSDYSCCKALWIGSIGTRLDS